MIAWVFLAGLALLSIGAGFAGLTMATDQRQGSGYRSVGSGVVLLGLVGVYLVVQLAARVLRDMGGI